MKESTVHSWATKYKEGWKNEGEVKPNLKVNFISSAKQGRPLLIGETLDNQVKHKHDCSGPICTVIVVAVGKAAVQKFVMNLLSEHRVLYP